MLGLAAALVVAGCTATPPAADDLVTVTSTVGAAADPAMASDPVAAPSSTGPVVVPPLGGGVETTSTTPSTDIQVEPTSSMAPTSTTTKTTPVKATPTKTAPPKPKPKPAKVSTKPANRATNIDPLGEIRVRSYGGHLVAVSLYTPEGRKLPSGKFYAGKHVYTVIPELGYHRTYTLRWKALADDGTVTTGESTFTTVKPKALVTASSFPRNGMTVGVGQPISITFSKPIKGTLAKQYVERQITVSTSPKQRGKFRWFSDTELHWRPEAFWRAGTRVYVDADIYGKNLSHGLYGQQDLEFRFKIGRRLVAVVDDKTHQMTINLNGKTIKTMPVSLGMDKYPTYNGVHIVAEKYRTKVMDSRTWGLVGTGAYRTTVKWATRISSSGEFVHAAPWSVYAQGNSNVSHGCVNVSDANALWFYAKFTHGDPVIIKNTKGPKLKSYDGYGDWQINYGFY